jgi:hypothetical protein
LFDPLTPALIALAVSHGVSFAANFVGRREYESASVGELMMAPYRRIVVMHLTILLGGWLVLSAEAMAPVLGLLILLKTALDYRAHRWEHGA